ncbi:MAG TPA: heparan-alpha-glucosaminide N-acetyltransferase domain-containing protein [Anseongella sp.]
MDTGAALKKRLLSLDVFRGVTVAAMILVNNPGDWGNVYSPLLHAHWNGCSPTDLVFPFFLFIVGVSIAYALSTKKQDRAARPGLLKKIAVRTLILFGLGLILHLFPRFDFSTVRIPGVLQRIAVVYLIASLLFLWLSPRRLAWTAGGLLVFYYLSMTLVPVPGTGVPSLEPETNLGAWIDRTLLTTTHLWKSSKTWDPEGIWSTIPAVATALGGILCGLWMKKEDDAGNKVAWMFIFGISGILGGLAWDLFFPINKSLWTSSFVLYTGGWAVCGLALLYWLIDVKGYRRFTTPPVVYGINAITVFFVSGLVPRMLTRIDVAEGINLRQWLYQTLYTPWLSPVNASLAWAVSYVLGWYLILWIMYRRGIVIKV